MLVRLIGYRFLKPTLLERSKNGHYARTSEEDDVNTKLPTYDDKVLKSGPTPFPYLTIAPNTGVYPHHGHTHARDCPPQDR